MPGTTPELRQIAVAIVAQAGTCRPNALVQQLRRDHGASHRAANETLLTLIRDGLLRRTWWGRLRVPG